MRLVCAAILCALAMPAEARMPRRPPPPITLAPLTWDMTVDDARAALERAKMAPKYDETRRYMTREPGQPIVHTTEPGFSFTPRTGWRGVAHFNWNADAKDYRMDHVTWSVEGLSEGALKDELAALASMHGTPAVKRTNQQIWVRGGTWLAAWSGQNPDTRKWALTVTVRLDARPAPAP